MRFFRSLFLISIFLVILVPVCVFADTEVRVTKSGPILVIDEPNVKMDVNLELMNDVIRMVMEKHIDRDNFNTTKMSLGITRGFLEGIGVRKYVLSGITENARHAKDGSSNRTLRVMSGDRVLDIDLGILFEEIRIEAEAGHLKDSANQQKLVVSMTNGFMGSLDKYSRYLTVKEADDILGPMKGEPNKAGKVLQTVGFEVGIKNGRKVGFIQIICFDKNTAKQFEACARAVMAENPEFLIVDLRDNPGGYLETVAESLAMAVGKGKVIFTVENPPGKMTPVKTLDECGSGLFVPLKKIVCLVNRGTASAGEVMAAGLHDLLHAELIGERTYGKGTGWSPYEMTRNRGVCIITDMRWFTPSGKCIKDIGLEPELKAPRTLKDIFAGKDPQMDAAFNELFK